MRFASLRRSSLAALDMTLSERLLTLVEHRMNSDDMISIANKGQIIAKTNFFDSQYARRGLFYLSWNAGAGRLLVPDSQKRAISEMRSAKYVIVSRGPWLEYDGADALELLFEDFSDAPYVLTIKQEACDRPLPATDQGGGFLISAWTRGGQKLCLPGR